MTPPTYTAFADGRRHLATNGSLAAVVLAAREALAGGATAAVLFDDASGKMTEVEPSADPAAVANRLGISLPAPGPAGPGRPKLGVACKEVSLLPRHWDWLAGQSGGASAALRRLVEDAIKREGGAGRARAARDAAYKFMSMLAGNEPQFEEVTRALYRGEDDQVAALTAGWTPDLRDHLLRLVAAERSSMSMT